MLTAAVCNLNDQRLIQEGEQAVDLYNKDMRNARTRIMPMALGLLAARRMYPGNQDFGDWLQTSSYREIEYNERAALIKIGEHAEFATKFVRTTSLISPRTIWDAIEDLLPSSHHVKTTSTFPQSDAALSTAPLASKSDESQTQKTPAPRHSVIGSGNAPVKNPASLELSKLGFAVDDVVVLLSAYPYKRQRALKTMLSKMAASRGRNSSQREIAIKLFARGVDVVKTNRAPDLSDSDKIDPRIFFANLPEGWCKHREINFTKEFDRFVQIDQRAAELSGMPLRDVFRELSYMLETGKPLPPAPVIQFPVDSRIQHQVKYCGEVIWPSSDLNGVEYNDLRAGWHLADYWLKYVEVAKPLKPNEVLTQVMHLLQDIKAAHSIDGLCRVMSACIGAYAKQNQRKDLADFGGGVPPGLAR